MAKRSRYFGINPLAVLQRARNEFGIDSVIVGVSGGLDSIATLSLCRSTFSRVEAYFMYVVPGLSFQERYLQYLERRFGVELLRIPHWAVARSLRGATFRHATPSSVSVPALKMSDVDAYIRRQFGIDWIATGEKANDSLERAAQIKRCGGIHEGRKRIFPLATWSHADVANHLARERIVAPPDYRLRPAETHRGNFDYLLSFDEIVPIKEHFPEDFEKIKQVFPLIEAQIERARILAKRRPDLIHVKTTRQARERQQKRHESQREQEQSAEPRGDGASG